MTNVNFLVLSCFLSVYTVAMVLADTGRLVSKLPDELTRGSLIEAVFFFFVLKMDWAN